MTAFKAQSKSLYTWQQEEFARVQLRQTEMNEQLSSHKFDPSIQLKLKLKPKFTLRQSNESEASQTQIFPPSLPEFDSACSVSVVITVYNRAEYLPEAIDSVLAQSYRDYELIIWDDGSTDSSLAIARKYAQFDRRIEVFSDRNRGQGVAISKAIAKSRGKYIAQLDSDDRLHPEALSKTVAMLDSDSRIGMVYTNHLVMDAEGNVKGLGNRSSIPYSSQRLLVDFMTFHLRLIRREVYDAVGGYDIHLGTAEDYDLCLKLSEATEIKHLDEPLYYYRWHQNSISTTQQLRQTECSTIAVNRALVRRGLSQKLRLEVKLNPQYILQRQTKVANKVFGIGLSNTGTSSLNRALTLLGIPSIHLPHSLSQIGKFDGASDLPVAVFFKELDRLYPGSKFILTIRNTRDWLKSYQLYEQRLLKIYRGSPPDWLRELTIRCYGQEQFNPQQWLKAYARHLKLVTEYFQSRSSDLLIFNMYGGQGWQELCDFLGCCIPKAPFPLNDRQQIISK